MLPSKFLSKYPGVVFMILLVIIHIVYARHLFRPGMFQTHDGELHTARIAAYSKAFADIHIPPRWAGDLNYGYGTPALIFHYPLPGYIGSALHAFGFSYEHSFKLLLGAAFILSSIGFFLWMRTFFSPLTSFASTLFYGLAPYHFLDLYVRGAIGELFAFVFIPFVFFCIEQVKKNRHVFVYAAGISYAFLILSHNIFSLVVSPVVLLYAFARLKGIKHGFLYTVCIIVIGLACSAYFWIPALFEQRFTHSTLFIGTKYKNHFVSLYSLLTSPWGFGPDVNSPGGLSPQIGILPLLAAIAGIVWGRPKKLLWLYGGAITALAVSIFFSTPISAFAWQLLPFISTFEFPWRFTALSSLSCAVLAAFFLHRTKYPVVTTGIIGVLLATSIQFANVSSMVSKMDSYYESFEGSTDFGAATPVWTAGDPSAYPKEPVTLFGGEGTITNFIKSSARHSFEIVTTQDVTLVDNTLYFPGWKVFIDGVKTPIEFQNQLHRGLITFAVPGGNHTVDVVFTDSPVRLVSNVISGTGVIAMVVLFGLSLRKKNV